MPIRRFFWLPVALFVVWILPIGCSPRDPFPELYPLTGTVALDGKSVTGGGVIFVLDSGERSALVVNAAVKPDGTFTAQTEYAGDNGTVTRPGAPAGKYKAIYHPAGDGSKTDLAREISDRVLVEGKATTVTVVVPVRPAADPKPEK
ncbi:unnamed protein product [Gemmata massiliana]|uniref:Carboxypeptidase regulatory-like domain-containing protein n=1 Tax=Gemmata massiliana TaxID=1210884 RepID=A0A6P2D900_9BACT|nr:hypothetical protein [Gemmata massiliana]VTR95970.1 unnamed protein product [Gemmata massiliana]